MRANPDPNPHPHPNPNPKQVRTEHRFELTLSEPLLIGMRRAAQRMLGAAQKRVAAGEKPDDVTPMLAEELAKISQA